MSVGVEQVARRVLAEVESEAAFTVSKRDVAAVARAYLEAAETLRRALEALDDAITHNVNATPKDSAGWTQKDYDSWNAARDAVETLLGSHGGELSRPCLNCGSREQTVVCADCGRLNPAEESR